MFSKRINSATRIFPCVQMTGEVVFSPTTRRYLSDKTPLLFHAIAENNQMEASKTPLIFRQHFMRGDRAASNQDFKTALHHFQSAIASLPENADAKYRLITEMHIDNVNEQLQRYEGNILAEKEKQRSKLALTIAAFVICCFFTVSGNTQRVN